MGQRQGQNCPLSKTKTIENLKMPLTLFSDG
jgi:hypothetical protein